MKENYIIEKICPKCGQNTVSLRRFPERTMKPLSARTAGHGKHFKASAWSRSNKRKSLTPFIDAAGRNIHNSPSESLCNIYLKYDLILCDFRGNMCTTKGKRRNRNEVHFK